MSNTSNSNQEKKRALPNIYENPKVGNGLLLFGVVMFLIFIASAYMIAVHRQTHSLTAITLGAVWVIGVPVFFFIEHMVLFRHFGNPSQYDQFKRVQELAGKIWAGAIVVLAAFFAQTFPK